ncbi:aliphatic sulfonate ABC transporter substrate-binding protein [Sphingomonas sp. H39-1-10]|nr:aliphatic sulfonate ABC transporter substrate-binding protein [Sphingomonas pollutisoli]MDF0490112.1 aliphatic sulfonate ABC transporter substrate-binding protein [Sphingomonas pollutisoli]PJG45467.1 sulfonate ABC transporter substrate-binding protein [Sphingobium sp. LB126]
MITRRGFGIFAGSLAVGGFAALTSCSADRKTLRVGFQKGIGTIMYLKDSGILERKLDPLGWSVAWKEFVAGPQMLEAINLGAADFGPVGETPPIFAQAAAADILYAGCEPPSPRSEAIIVPKGSTIRTVADLKGKRVAFVKGSNVHYLVLRALETSGLGYSDIVPVYLTPADAGAAFERGAIDAWGTWDPYLSAAELNTAARSITDATGLAPNIMFYMAARPLAEHNPLVLEAALSAVNEAGQWAQRNRKAFAAILAAQIGVSREVAERAADRSEFGAGAISDETLGKEQEIADLFFKLKLIPKAVDVRSAAWRAPAPSGAGGR